MINENWDLGSLYSGGTESQRLREMITCLKNNIGLQIEIINRLELPIERNNIPDLLSLLQEIQEIMNGSLEVDDFLICLYSENVEDTEALYLLEESAQIKTDFETLKSSIPTT